MRDEETSVETSVETGALVDDADNKTGDEAAAGDLAESHGEARPDSFISASAEISDDPEDDDDDDTGTEGDDGEDEDDDDDVDDVIIYDADAEDAAEKLAAMRREAAALSTGDVVNHDDAGEIAPGGSRSMAELISIIEALIFVSEEPLQAKTLAQVWDVEELVRALREVANGWQFATRPEHHDHVRAFLKSRPSAKLSLAALETLAVIAYKQPITVPEILEIRGVQSSSAIKTLLDKRLIVAKGRKETVGRPMMYGTSKEFLMQFGLKDLSELPNVEDFEDLATGGA